MRLRCPHCFAEIEISDHYAGRLFECSACGKTAEAPENNPPIQLNIPPEPVRRPKRSLPWTGIGLTVGTVMLLFAAGVAGVRLAAMPGGTSQEPTSGATTGKTQELGLPEFVVGSKGKNLFWDWVNANEGDPSAVEIIKLQGPRYFATRTSYKGEEVRTAELYQVKYRHKNAVGAKIVSTHVFWLTRDGELAMSGRFDTFEYQWDAGANTPESAFEALIERDGELRQLRSKASRPSNVATGGGLRGPESNPSR